VGERFARAWRAFSRPGSGREGGGALGGGVAGAARGAEARSCGASGWQMRAGCTDGEGGVVCPVCSRRVRTRSHVVMRHRVEVIEAHTI
jgi:hypothetical protein